MIILNKKAQEILFKKLDKLIDEQSEMEKTFVRILDYTNRQTFICEGPNAKALGMKFGRSKFWVLKGSLARIENTNTFKTYLKKREGLIKNKVLTKSANKGSYCFVRNVLFDSPSAASSVILGKESSGKQDWRTIGGTKLGDLLKISDIFI